MPVKARYPIRFDDICPTMNWSVWARIEPLLNEFGVTPILAVVPDNQDPHLNVEPPRSDFWAWVRERQAAGWCIALHGYRHLYETSNSGIMKINPRSEFAGLPRPVQREKLMRALEIFKQNEVRADAWIAPGHSFDATTVSVLVELGVTTISDGFYLRPVQYLGAYWIPQQLWHFRPMLAGVWTVCLHSNPYGESEIRRLRDWLTAYRHAMTTVEQVKQQYAPRPLGLADRCFSAAIPAIRAVRRLIG